MVFYRKKIRPATEKNPQQVLFNGGGERIRGKHEK